jgi:hypothetical protein
MIEHEGGGRRRVSVSGSGRAMAREQDGSQKSSVGRHARQGNTGSLIEREGGRLWGEIFGLGKNWRGSHQHDDRLGPRETYE